jgi:membrane-bound lytic murein transglycosylase B
LAFLPAPHTSGRSAVRTEPLGVEAPQAEPVTDAPLGRYSATSLQGTAARTEVKASWLTATSAATGIPRRALEAYAKASLVLAKRNGACHLGWNTLAALGYQESGHGSHGGSRIAANGTVSPRILGPLLDGTDYAAIADTDRGRWDGSKKWDRAVGPLQFIPSTWERSGLDGNGDGVANPNNIDDAALTAGDYLCAGGRDLSSGAAWTAAINSFNHNERYVAEVRDVANVYAQRAGS